MGAPKPTRVLYGRGSRWGTTPRRSDAPLMVSMRGRGSKRRNPNNHGNLTETIRRYLKRVKVRQGPRKRRLQSYWRWLALSPSDSSASSVASNTNMCTNRDPILRAARWSEANENALLRRLHDYAIQYGGCKIDHKLWEKWAREFEADFGFSVTATQLTSKRERFKRYYECYNALLTDTGLGWNAQQRRAECSNERWAAFKKRFEFANKVRKDGIQNYDMLHDIFGRTDADGRVAIGSGSSCFRTQQQQCPESPEDDCEDDADVQDSGDRPTTRDVGKSSRGVHKRHKKKSRAAMNAEACEALMSITDTIKRTSTIASSRSKNSPDMPLKCMEIMNGMDLPDMIYCPAITIFIEDPAKAKMFYHMPEHRRNNWLGVLLDRPVDHPPASESFPPRTNDGPFNVLPSSK